MKETLEKIWNEYFAEECATVGTKEEKALTQKALELHKTVNESLTKEQLDVIEKYIDVLLEIQNAFVKKAFFKGCAFATSFLFETRTFEKT